MSTIQAETAEENITVAQALLAAFDATDAVRFIVKADGTIIHFNRKAYENGILLHKRELKRGDNIYDYAADTVNGVESTLKKDIDRAFKGQTFVRESEIKFDVESLWYETEHCPVILNNKVSAVALSITDITARKKREHETQEMIETMRSTKINRVQQFELMIHDLAGVVENLQIAARKKPLSVAAIQAAIQKLRSEVASMKKKILIWKKI
jgi:hypothetical protein